MFDENDRTEALDRNDMRTSFVRAFFVRFSPNLVWRTSMNVPKDASLKAYYVGFVKRPFHY